MYALGFPFFNHCTRKSLSDDWELIEMLSNNIDYFRLKTMNIPKITIFLDRGYYPDKIICELEKIYSAIAKKVQRVCPHVGKSGFVPIKT